MESEKRDKTNGQDTDAAVSETAATQGPDDYVTRVLDTPCGVPRDAWNALLAHERDPSPFMRHEYLCALDESGCASRRTGWQPHFLTLWRGTELHAACPMYLKDHSWGEYVFDWAWAQAHEQHGLPYYPKGLVAVPFTPVPGARLLARDTGARTALLHTLLDQVRRRRLSSLHLLFAQATDLQACAEAGLLLRHTVQFHWTNEGYGDFDDFLAALKQEKRKKIRQERRKVADAGIRVRWRLGPDIGPADWDFFYRCYAQTYREHGNPPYLSRDFFSRVARDLPGHWLLFLAERDGHPVASSLIGLDPERQVAYGRYWGALERVDCLHFELSYYQPIQWCVDQGYRRFEGGAQGEHKMARALLPVRTSSAHWLAHPAFTDAVQHFLDREEQGVGQYLEELARRQPLRQHSPAAEGLPHNRPDSHDGA